MCTRGASACPAAESRRKDPRPEEKTKADVLKSNINRYMCIRIRNTYTCLVCVTYEHMSLCKVRCCCTAAAVGLSAYCASPLQIQRKCGLESSGLFSGGQAHARTNTRTHRSTFRGCHEGNTLKCGCCCAMTAPTYKELRTGWYTHCSSRRHSEKSS